MELNQAIEMLKIEGFSLAGKWADLGCGSGTFTLALANLLEPDGIIYAVDTDQAALNKIPDRAGRIPIEKVVGDFVADEFSFDGLDGVLMANSLHYVPDQKDFISQFERRMKPTGCFLVVEYDTDTPNDWVPYPLSYRSLSRIFEDAGYGAIRRLHERPSIYWQKMYSVLIQK